jgi:tRNA threonylcarbamoyladenosine biosynthesis protein TsaB
MLILAIQTAINPANIALLDDDTILIEHTIYDRYSVCRDLAPQILQVLDETNHTVNDVALITVCSGPGSFTGIRIGVAAAKALAHSIGKPLVAVNALRALTTGTSDHCMLTFLNASRTAVFCAAYMASSVLIEPTMLPITHVKQWLLNAIQQVNGNMCEVVGEFDSAVLDAVAEQGLQITKRSVSAVSISKIGLERFKAGDIQDPISLIPYYLRLSSPEERITEAAK